MARGALLVALVIVGSVLGEYGWRPKQEYKYNIEGRSLTAVPGVKTQYTGLHYRGLLRVQSQATNVLLMKVQNMKYSRIHNAMPGGWWDDVPSSTDDFQLLPITGSTFTVKLDKGVVESLDVNKDVEDWEVNFIQGLVSQLQMDLSGSNGIHRSDTNIMHGKVKEEPIFGVMENTVVGRCEVIYEIAELPSASAIASAKPSVYALPREDVCGSRKYIEVTKTINYNNCETRAEYHFGMPSSLHCKPGSAKCGDFWSRSSVSQILGCGDRKDFLMVSAVRSSQLAANLHFHNASQAVVSSYLNLTLTSAKPVARRLDAPREPQTLKNLFFRYSTKSSSEQESPDSCELQDSQETSSPTGKPNKHEEHDESLSSAEEKNKNKRSKRASDKKKKSSKKDKYQTQVPSSKIVRTPFDSESSEESFTSWQLSKVDSQHAPHMPLSPFSLASRQGSERACLGQKFKEVITDIVNDFEMSNMTPETMTMEKVFIAVQIGRTMSYQDLRRSVGDIMDRQSKDVSTIVTERKLFRDIVAMCGTNPCFRLVKSWIEEKKVKGEAASEILATLPSHLITPSKDLIQQFYDLVRSSAVREDQQMKITAVLSFSNLIRVACLNATARNARYSVNFFGSQCTAKDGAKFVQWLASQLRSETGLRQVYARALGNTGASEAIPYLKTLAEDPKESPFQRASAVYAMKYRVFQDPDSVSPILLSVYHNIGYPTAVRIAAASMLFYAKPSTAIWQRIAVSTWYEPVPAVAAYVRSSLASLAVLEDPTYKQMSKKAAAVLFLSKPIKKNGHLPYNYVKTSVSDQIDQILLEQLSWLPGPDTTNLYYRHTQRLGGFSRVNFDGEMSIANTDDFILMLQELVYPSDDITIARPMVKNLPRPTKWLREALNISPRVMPHLEGALHFNWNQLSERLFPFDKKIPMDLAKAGRKLLDQMKAGKKFHYQKMGQSQMVMSTTTEMGLPISYQVTVPWAIRAVGNTTLNKDKKQLSMDSSIMYTTQLISDLSIYTDWDHTVHVAAAYANTLLQLPPMRFMAQIDTPNSQMEIGISTLEPNENTRLVHHSSHSFTVQDDALALKPMSQSKAVKSLRKRAPIKMNMMLLPNLRMEYSSESPVSTINDHMRNSISILGFSLMWPTLDYNSVDLNLKDPAPITVKMSLEGATVDDGQIRISNGTKQSDENKSKRNKSSQEIGNIEVEKETTTQQTDSSTVTEWPTTSTTEISTQEKKMEKNGTSLEKGNRSENQNESSSSNNNEKHVVFIHTIEVEQNSATFNASYMNPFGSENSVNGNQYVLNEALRGISSGKAYVVAVNLTVHAPEPLRYFAFGAYAEAVGKKHHRTGVFWKNEKANSEMALTSITNEPSPPVLDFEHILNTTLLARFDSDYIYKFNQTQWQLALQGTITRGEQRMASLRSSTLYNQCVALNQTLSRSCRSMAEKAISLDHYNVTLTINEELKKAFSGPVSHALDIAENILYPYKVESQDQQDYSGGNVRVTFELSDDGRTGDWSLQTAHANLQFIDVPVSPLLATAISYNPDQTVLQSLLTRPQGYCGLSNKTVMTYDGVAFNYTLGDCWHVISKDCSGKSRIAILAKNKNKKTELEINLDNFKVISLRPGPEVWVNQKMMMVSDNQVAVIEDEAGTQLAQVSLTPDNTIKTWLPAYGFTVVYTNATVLITADVRTHGRLCGLCGDNDGNVLGEFKIPSGQLEAKPSVFAASYALKDKECKEYPKSH